MRPTRLQVRNFMSYEHANLDLSDVSLAAIVGTNGAGKSTLLQAITYALWGEVRTSSHNDVVRRGCGSCAVVLDFEALDTEFRVTRRRDISGRGSSDLELSELSTIDKMPYPMTAATIKDTQEKIDGIVGMSYAAFAASALLQQGEASRFSDARPGIRKELLAEMLGLGWFQRLEQLARQRAREVDVSLIAEQARLSSAEEEIGAVEDPALAIADATFELGQVRDDIQLHEKNLETAKAYADGLKSLQQEHEQSKKLLKAYITRLIELDEDLDRLNLEWERNETIIATKDEVEALKERYDGLKLQAEGMYPLARKYDELQATIKSIRSAMALDERCTEDRDEALEEIQHRTEIAEEYKDDIARLKHNSTRGYEQRRELQSELAESRAQINQLKDRYATLEGNEMCPTCGADLDDPELMLRLLDEQICAAEEVEETVSTTMKQLILEINEINAELENTQNNLAVIQQELSEWNTNLKVAETAVERFKIQLDKLSTCLAELDALEYDPEGHKAIEEELTALADIPELYTEVLHAIDRQAVVVAELEETKTRIGKGRGLRDKELGSLNEINLKIDGYPSEVELAARVAEIQSQLTEARMRETDLVRILAQLDAIKERLEKLTIQIGATKEGITELEKAKSTADWLVKASSKTGAQALLIEAALPQLELDANEYLGVMANNMKLALMSQRQTQKGGATETLDIVVYSDGQQAPIETLSGGERFRADLSLRLAIGRMLSRKSNTKIGMLAIDEGFGSQDADGQEAVADVLVSLAGYFPLILVISHVPAVAEAVGVVGNTIQVTKIGNKSTISLN